MRIISGKFRGRKLIKFNKEGIKPTTDKMRESVFNIVISYLKINEKKNNLPLEHFNVLDIFAGTGALGLEAISRGAEKVTFIEKSRDNLRVLYKNTDLLEIKEKVKIIKKSIRNVKKIEGQFDLIFMDPPYQMDLIIKKTLKKILDFKIIKKETIIYWNNLISKILIKYYDHSSLKYFTKTSNKINKYYIDNNRL